MSVVGWAGACEPEPEPEPVPTPEPKPVLLASVDGWTRVAEVASDVFGAERPEGLTCDEAGLSLESVGPDPVFEVKTDLCNYATARQATLRPLKTGDTLAIRMWHWPLEAASPAEAHLALALDGELLWETHLAIPADPALIQDEVTIARDLPQGTELQFHVHNHGINAYDIYDLKVTPGSVDPG